MMPRIRLDILSLAVAVAVLLPFRDAAAQSPNAGSAQEEYYRILPHMYCCVRTSMPMRIDGVADETAWKQVRWTEDFVDIEGALRPAPRYRTRVKMLWDETHFYVYAEMEEPHVWARLRQRDTVIFYDNDFEIFVCPTGSNHTYYEFEVNAFNTVWDLFLPRPYRDDGQADNAWDIDRLQSAVHVRGSINDPSDIDRGWSVEVAIPWTAFNRTTMQHEGRIIPIAATPPFTGQSMRVNFSRVEWKHALEGRAYRKIEGLREDNWVWSPQGVIDMHRPEKWGWVFFVQHTVGCTGLDPDAEYPYHMALMRIYWAQKAFHKQHGNFAKGIQELGLTAQQLRVDGKEALLVTADEEYEAYYTVTSPGGERTRISIDQSSRLGTYITAGR